MDDQRSVRIAAVFAHRSADGVRPELCERSAEALAVDGAGITLMTGSSTGPVCSTSERVGRLEDVQFSLGEGPCRDAFRTGLAVLEPELAGAAAIARWPTFTGSAVVEGAGAAFAFPLSGGSVGIGVLTIYQDAPGDLSEEQRLDGPLVADHVSRAILDLQADVGSLALPADLEAAVEHRAEVHQASGKVAVQQSISPGEALVRIRAYAYGNDRAVLAVAKDIVARRLRLDP